MIILITGDKGFIGSHLRESLIDEGHIVLGFDHEDDYDVGNITDDIVKKVNKIVHLVHTQMFGQVWKNPTNGMRTM